MRFAPLLLVLLLLAACSSTVETTADDPPGVTPEPTATAQAEGQVEAPREVPPLVLPNEAPGTDEAYQAMIDELERFLTDEQLAVVPWPDSRNPDPVAAYQSSATFQNWMSENNTAPSLVEAYTAPGSPERGWDVDMFADFTLFDIVSTPSTPPYSMRIEALVHPAATSITDALLRQVPEGSAAVVYWDSVGSSQMVRPDGSVFSSNQGWTDEGPWVAIMAPTDVGWQVWWDELTEVPPQGFDQNRGLPAEPPPRRDLN